MHAMLILVALVAADDAKAQPKSKPATPADVLTKRRAYVEIRRVEVRKTLTAALRQAARAKAVYQARYRDPMYRQSRRSNGAKIVQMVALEKQIKKDLAETKSKTWIPDLQFTVPTVHACGFVKTGESLIVTVTKIEGPASALCEIRLSTSRRRRESPVFRFKIPTAKLLVDKPALLDGVYAIAAKDETNPTPVWIVEPIRGEELVATPKK